MISILHIKLAVPFKLMINEITKSATEYSPNRTNSFLVLQVKAQVTNKDQSASKSCLPQICLEDTLKRANQFLRQRTIKSNHKLQLGRMNKLNLYNQYPISIIRKQLFYRLPKFRDAGQLAIKGVL